MGDDPQLWTWAVVKIDTMGDLQKLEIPRLQQIKAIHLRIWFHSSCIRRQPKQLEKLLQALLAFPNIKKMYGLANFGFISVEPSVAAVLGSLDELNMAGGVRKLSQAKCEQVFTVIAKNANPMKKLSLNGWGMDGLSPTMLKELELYHWSENHLKALFRQIVESERPLAKLKIHFSFSRDLCNIDADLVSRALNSMVLQVMKLVGDVK